VAERDAVQVVARPRRNGKTTKAVEWVLAGAPTDSEAREGESAEKGVFHSARVMTHMAGNGIECSCGWSVVMPTALGVINAYGDHRAAAVWLREHWQGDQQSGLEALRAVVARQAEEARRG
jgi:hypothetical protein